MKDFGIIGLKNYFKSDNDYKKFLDDLNSLELEFMSKYAFLKLKESTWDNLFHDVLEKNLKNLDKAIILAMIQKAIKNYMKKQIKARKTRILASLLMFLYKEYKNYKDLLKQFFRRLEVEEIVIDEEYFSLLKCESLLLKNCLNSLGVYDLSLAELKEFLNKKDELYSRFQKSGYSYKERKALLDYIISCFADEAIIRRRLLYDRNHEDSKKVNLFWVKYTDILKIHELFEQEIGKVDCKRIDMVILSYSYKDMRKLFDSYYEYSMFKKDLTFLNVLAKRVGINNIILNSKRTPITSRPEIPILTTKKAAPVASMPTLSSSNEKVIDATSIQASLHLEAAQEKSSFNMESKKDKKLLHSNVTSRRGRKRYASIYEYFPIREGISIEERNQIVDILFKREDLETQKIIKDYILGKFKVEDERYKTFRSAIDSMICKYNRYGKEILNPGFEIPQEVNRKKKSTIYGYFPIREGISEEERNKIVDILLKEEDLETQNIINDYILGKFKVEDERYKTFRNAIRSMRYKYNKYGKEILNPEFEIPQEVNRQKKSTIYGYFPIREGISEEERNQIVDILYKKEDLETQNIINDYILGKFKKKDERYKVFRNAIKSMRRKYNKYGKKILNPEAEAPQEVNSQKKSTIYGYFPIREGISEEERNKIVDILFKKEDLETQNIINDYILGKFKRKDERYKIVDSVIKSMRRKYNKYGKEILNPEFEIPQEVRGRKKNKEEQNKNVGDYLKQEVSTSFNNIVFLIKEEFGAELEAILESKQFILYDALKVIEYIYRENFKTNGEEYREYFNKRIIELFTLSFNSLEDLIVAYINDEYKVIKSRER